MAAPKSLDELRCKCHRLLMMVSTGRIRIESKCPRCGHISKFEVGDRGPH